MFILSPYFFAVRDVIMDTVGFDCEQKSGNKNLIFLCTLNHY